MSDLKDFVIEDGVLIEYVGPGGDVVVPNSVTTIAKNAFYGKKSLTSIIIPNSVKKIGVRAFCGCEKLRNVSLSNSITSLANSTFSDCCSLTDIIIPSGVTNIGNEVFQFCNKLTEITIPNEVKTIGEGAFWCCKNLKKVFLSKKCKKIGSKAFFHCENLSDINLASLSDVEIGKGAFFGCNKLIDENGFFTFKNRLLIAHCENENCSEIVISKSVESVDVSSFSNNFKTFIKMNIKCPIWETDGKAKVYGEAESIITEDGSTICFTDDNGETVAKIILAISNETEPKQNGAILSIRQEAHRFDFVGYDAYWMNLAEKINKIRIAIARLQYPYALSDEMHEKYFSFLQKNGIQAGMMLIDKDNIEDLNTMLIQQVFKRETIQALIDYATSNAKSEATALLLASVSSAPIKKTPTKKTKIDTTSKIKISKDSLSYSLTLAEAKKEWKFVKDNKLGGYKISGYLGKDTYPVMPSYIDDIPVVTISNNAFKRCEFSEIKLPDTLTTMGESVFYDGELIKIEFPDNLSELPKSILGCDDLREVVLPKNLTKLNAWAFPPHCEPNYSLPSLEKITIDVDNPYYGTYNNVVIDKKKKKIIYCAAKQKTVVIPKWVTEVGTEIFSYTELKDIYLHEKVKKIHDRAFVGCENLIIHAPTGSYAEQYAKENNIPFVAE